MECSKQGARQGQSYRPEGSRITVRGGGGTKDEKGVKVSISLRKMHSPGVYSHHATNILILVGTNAEGMLSNHHFRPWHEGFPHVKGLSILSSLRHTVFLLP